MDYFDISPPLSESIAVFPGDTPLSFERLMEFEKGQHLKLSTLRATLHLGAHTDAPNHYQAQGCDMATRALNFYFGPAQVVELNLKRNQRIRADDIDLSKITTSRVLFKTSSFPDPNQWNDDFNSLSPDLIEALVRLGVCLVGIDTPSIDPAYDRSLESHKAVAKHNLAILEGIDLRGVPAACYTLFALPLRLVGADASPVRALLFRAGFDFSKETMSPTGAHQK